MKVIKALGYKAKQDIVLTAAWILGIISACNIIPPYQYYITYLDGKTLGLLFSLDDCYGRITKSGIFYKNWKLVYWSREKYAVIVCQLNIFVFFFQYVNYK